MVFYSCNRPCFAPFDCAFSSDKKDEKKSFELLFNYCAIKMVFELINNENLVLTKTQKKIFNIIQAEFKMMKKLLNVNPYYSEIPMINGFIKSIIKAKPELKIKVSRFQEDLLLALIKIQVKFFFLKANLKQVALLIQELFIDV